MADLGHYEFGELHKPIAFPGLDALISNFDTLTIDYWLAYWIAAFDYIYARRDSVILVSYEDICRDGERGLRNVLKKLGIDNGGVLQSAAQILRAPSQLRYTDFEINPDLGKRAEVLYESLLSH